MAADWKQVTHGTFLAHVARMESFALSIIGDNGEWWRLVHRGECTLAEGTARTLMGAKMAAEDAAHGLAGEGA